MFCNPSPTGFYGSGSGDGSGDGTGGTGGTSGGSGDGTTGDGTSGDDSTDQDPLFQISSLGTGQLTTTINAVGDESYYRKVGIAETERLERDGGIREGNRNDTIETK
ncbi:MAG: hypothetical protein AAFN77_24680, partial [Planctomycetota bacterium]